MLFYYFVMFCVFAEMHQVDMLTVDSKPRYAVNRDYDDLSMVDI